MFARSRFATADRIEQHRILRRAASMIDAGQLRGTLSETLGTINAANLDMMHLALYGSPMRSAPRGSTISPT